MMPSRSTWKGCCNEHSDRSPEHHRRRQGPLVAAGKRGLAGKAVEANATLNFGSYDDMHRVLARSCLTIVKTLAGQGALSIREVARRVGRDVQAVHRDVTTLINAGVIDRTEKGIEFSYARIHFEFDVSAAA